MSARERNAKGQFLPVPERTCVSPDGCSRTDLQGYGLCQKHYARWRRHGSTTVVLKPAPLDQDGRRRPRNTTCEISGCDQAPDGRYCKKHAARIARHGDPHKVITHAERGFRTGAEHHSWLADGTATYNAVHFRLRDALGRASGRVCVDCGGQAAQWSYDHSDPEAKTSPEGMPFSESMDNYSPRCHSCHIIFDRSRS